MHPNIPHTPETTQHEQLGAQIAAGISALYAYDIARAQQVIDTVAREFYIEGPDGVHVPNYNHPCTAAFAELVAGVQSMARPVADDL